MLNTIREFEIQILNLIQAGCQNSVFDKIMPVISFLGNLGIVWIIIAIVLLAQKRRRIYGIILIIALLAGVLIGNAVIKEAVDRVRPFTFRPNINLLINCPTDSSFPSGHALSSFAAATVLLCVDKKHIGIPALVLALLISFSRLYLYVHYPSDVLCGALMGAGIGAGIYFLVLKLIVPRVSRVFPQLCPATGNITALETVREPVFEVHPDSGMFKLPSTEHPLSFKGAIFDIDGTLLDSVTMWHQIDVDFLGRRGIEAPEDYMIKIGHLQFNKIAEYTIERFGLNETPDQLISEWRSMAREAYATKVEAKPGAIEYLKKLKADGVKIAIATALERELFEIALKHTGIYDMIDVFSNIYELGCEKGTPQVYEHAAQEMGLSVDDCVVFEDIVAGVTGAKGAASNIPGKQGFTVIGVYNEASDSIAKEMSNLCDYFIKDYYDLLQ